MTESQDLLAPKVQQVPTALVLAMRDQFNLDLLEMMALQELLVPKVQQVPTALVLNLD
jgi:hypothetical protein